MIIRILAVFFIFTGIFPLTAQDKYIIVEGLVKPDDAAATTVTVVVSKGGKNKKTYTTKPDGRYKLELDFQSVFDIEFVLSGYVTRKFVIDTKVPKEIYEEGLMPFFLDVLMFKPMDNLAEETGRIKFDEREYSLVLEQEHLRTLKAQEKKVEAIKSGNEQYLAKLEEERKRKEAEEARLKREAEEKRLKEEEEARLKREKEEAERRLKEELARLRKLNNIQEFPTEQDRLNALSTQEKAALRNSGYVVLKPYDTIEQLGSQYYGYVNFGIGGGNIEITREEFDRLKALFK